MRKEIIMLILGGVIIIILAGILIFGKNKKDIAKITDFESCAKAGNPVFQSYPRMCKTSDGRTFTE